MPVSALLPFLLSLLLCTWGLAESSDKNNPAMPKPTPSKAKNTVRPKQAVPAANVPTLILLIYSPEARDMAFLQNKEDLIPLSEAAVSTLRNALQEADRYQTGLSLAIMDEEDQADMKGPGARQKVIRVEPDYTLRIHYGSPARDPLQPTVYKVRITVKVNPNLEKINDPHSFQFSTEVDTEDARLSPLKPLAWDIVEEIRKHNHLKELPHYKLAIQCFLTPPNEQARLNEFIQSARRSVQATLNNHLKALNVVGPNDCSQSQKPEKDALFYLFGTITLSHAQEPEMESGELDLDVYHEPTQQNRIAFYTHPKFKGWDLDSGWERGKAAAMELEQQLEGIDFHRKLKGMLKEDGR